jgi:subfamily B ATP-binding cassette protein MsbA
VSFALRGASFALGTGQVVAIVGLSGAGKTTLVNLIPRFYDVKEGAILIDGVDIRDVTLASLRDQIALVTQDTVLFDETVAANIAYGAPGASPEAIEAAARAAHAHTFIEQLEGGYEARIGERGQLLSGGQRQRLAIARAVLADRPILLFDEATSSLDHATEAAVQRSLGAATHGRTTIVVAHRLSTIRHADLICVLDAGRVAEAGRHDDLLAAGGTYASMWRVQTGDARHRAPAARVPRRAPRRKPPA